MKEALLNIVAISVVCVPLIGFYALKSKSHWLRDNEWLGFVVWFAALVFLYMYVLPRLGLVQNPEFFRNQY